MLVYLRDGSAQTVLRPATLRLEVADQTFSLTQSQYTDTGPTSPSADPITPGAWQSSHWSSDFEVTGMTRPGKIPSQAGIEPRIFCSRGGRLNHSANEAVSCVRAVVGGVSRCLTMYRFGGLVGRRQSGESASVVCCLLHMLV